MRGRVFPSLLPQDFRGLVGLDWPFSGAPKVPWRSEVLCIENKRHGSSDLHKALNTYRGTSYSPRITFKRRNNLWFPTAKRPRAFVASHEDSASKLGLLRLTPKAHCEFVTEVTTICQETRKLGTACIFLQVGPGFRSRHPPAALLLTNHDQGFRCALLCVRQVRQGYCIQY